jgi:hypothetical protein
MLQIKAAGQTYMFLEKDQRKICRIANMCDFRNLRADTAILAIRAKAACIGVGHQVIKNESPFRSFASYFEIYTGGAHNTPYSANEMRIF